MLMNKFMTRSGRINLAENGSQIAVQKGLKHLIEAFITCSETLKLFLIPVLFSSHFVTFVISCYM